MFNIKRGFVSLSCILIIIIKSVLIILIAEKNMQKLFSNTYRIIKSSKIFLLVPEMAFETILS